MMSANDFIVGSLLAGNHSLIAPLQFLYESMTLLTLGIWVAYAALPEPVSKLAVVPVNSYLLRWNEIATALGHTGTQVAVRQPAGGFLLTDVEKVVEAVNGRDA
jgi:hypothetical protein